MTPFWSIKSGGSHRTSIDVEERILTWIALGVPDGSGEGEGNKFWQIALIAFHKIEHIYS